LPDTVDPVRALLERARALDGARDYPALVALLESESRDRVMGDPSLGFLWADVLRRVGRGEEAMTVLNDLEPTLGRRGNDRLHRRRLNLLGSLHFEAGAVKEAGTTWLRQLNDSAAVGDEEFAARASNNLGVVATLQGHLPEALAHYGRAVASYQRLGYVRGLAQSHQNLAITYREMEFPRESDHHFRRAIQLARRAESEDEVARAEQERSLLLYLMGDVALAQATADRAMARYEKLGDVAGQGEVHRVRGLIALGERELERSAEAIGQALDCASVGSSMLLEAESLEARAALSRELGNQEVAEDDEARAEELFGSMGAPGWGARIRHRTRAIALRGSYGPERSSLQG
jgi:tetratricopeptide (TPR) repeat protein